MDGLLWLGSYTSVVNDWFRLELLELTLYLSSIRVLGAQAQWTIIGLPWLKLYNPWIHWQEAQIEMWSSACQDRCLASCLQAMSVESLPTKLPVSIPEQYRDLTEVFSDARAAHFPPHWLWDCAIDLLPSATPLWSWVCPLSEVESQGNEGLRGRGFPVGVH